VQPLFNFTGTISEKLNQLSVLLAESIEGMKGVEELRFICDNVAELGLSTAILDLDVTLARGLNYYTGAILRFRLNQLQWDPLAVAVDMMI
jgi:histidyl-tRNA synthetase